VLELVLGKLRTNPSTGQVDWAGATRMTYELGGGASSADSVDWQRAFIRRCGQLNGGLRSVSLHCAAPQYWIDEGERASKKDQRLMARGSRCWVGLIFSRQP